MYMCLRQQKLTVIAGQVGLDRCTLLKKGDWEDLGSKDVCTCIRNKMCYIPNTVDGTVNWSGRCLNKEQSATLPASEVNLYQLT